MKTNFKSTGIVLGNLWGGGKCAYPSESLEADIKEELIDKAKEMLSDGSLDSGMGHESLIGARLDITTVTTIVMYGKEFINEKQDTVLIGELSEEQEDFLLFNY
jgi:hypothetical protein